MIKSLTQTAKPSTPRNKLVYLVVYLATCQTANYHNSSLGQRWLNGAANSQLTSHMYISRAPKHTIRPKSWGIMISSRRTNPSRSLFSFLILSDSRSARKKKQASLGIRQRTWFLLLSRSWVLTRMISLALRIDGRRASQARCSADSSFSFAYDTCFIVAKAKPSNSGAIMAHSRILAGLN